MTRTTQHDAALEPSGTADRAEPRGTGLAWVALAVAIAAAVVGLVLGPVGVRRPMFPPGWDAPYYAGRVHLLTGAGLSLTGLVRVGAPAYMAALGRITGLNAMTVAVVTPAISSTVLVLGMSALASEALDLGPVGSLSVGFGGWLALPLVSSIGHVDNLLGLALTTCAYATAAACLRSGRGAAATGLLLSASALIEWPFALVSIGILAVALAPFALRIRLPRRASPAWGEAVGRARRLVAAAGVAALVLGASLLVRPPGGWLGLALTGHVRGLLRSHLAESASSPQLVLTLAIGLVGVVALVRAGRSHRDAGRWFAISLAATWAAVAVVAAVAQVAGLPTAAARLLATPVVLAIVAAGFVWRLAAGSGTSGGDRRAPRAILPLVLVGVLGFVTWHAIDVRSQKYMWRGVSEIQAAGDALRGGTNRPVVFVIRVAGDFLGEGRRWHEIEAVLPDSFGTRIAPYFGTPLAFLRGERSARALDRSVPPTVDPGHLGGHRPVVLVIRGLNRYGYRAAVRHGVAHRVAPGVIALRGPGLAVPAPPGPEAATDVERLQTSAGVLFGCWAAGIGLLMLAGFGWARWMLPGGGFRAVTLAAGLGAAATIPFVIAWAAVAGSISRVGAVASVLAAALVGLAGSVVRRRRRPLPA